jgi:hypothetical protein
MRTSRRGAEKQSRAGFRARHHRLVDEARQDEQKGVPRSRAVQSGAGFRARHHQLVDEKRRDEQTRF